MRGRKNAGVPFPLVRAVQRLDAWRQSHSVGTRIPQSLWARAVVLAATYGVARTAAALRLNYYDLKKRAQAKRTQAAGSQSAAATTAPCPLPAFIELAPSTLVGPAECVIEFENATGCKMRVQLKGTQVPDLVALGVSFWEGHQ